MVIFWSEATRRAGEQTVEGMLAGGGCGWGARYQTKPGEEEQIGCWQGFGLVVGEDERGKGSETSDRARERR